MRVIAATNRTLRTLMEKGEFRGDLYYRLNVARLEFPPLRERPDDIAVLARHFAGRFAERYGREYRHLSQPALACLHAYGWPGNVRELRNAIEHAFALGTGPVIDADALPSEIRSAPRPPAGTIEAWSAGDFLPFQHVKETVITDFERRYLTQALEHADGNITQAAELSGPDDGDLAPACHSAAEVFDDPPALHHERHARRVVEQVRVAQRVAADGDHVRVLPGFDRADAVRGAEDARVGRGGADDRLHRPEDARLQQ